MTWRTVPSSSVRWEFHDPITEQWNDSLQPINLFISAADEIFGPITVTQTKGKVIKKIPWSTFRLSDNDWAYVKDVRLILKVCHGFLISTKL